MSEGSCYLCRATDVCKLCEKNNLVIFLFSLQHPQQTVNKLGCIYIIFSFSRNIVCARYHRKNKDPGSFVHCVLIPPFSHSVSRNPNASRSDFAFKSCGLTQRGSFLPHTSSEKRENQKDTKSRRAIQWGENSFCHRCHPA